jgi:hypothetical protein
MGWWQKSETWLQKLLPLTWWQLWLITVTAIALVSIVGTLIERASAILAG